MDIFLDIWYYLKSWTVKSWRRLRQVTLHQWYIISKYFLMALMVGMMFIFNLYATQGSISFAYNSGDVDLDVYSARSQTDNFSFSLSNVTFMNEACKAGETTTTGTSSMLDCVKWAPTDGSWSVKPESNYEYVLTSDIKNYFDIYTWKDNWTGQEVYKFFNSTNSYEESGLSSRYEYVQSGQTEALYYITRYIPNWTSQNITKFMKSSTFNENSSSNYFKVDDTVYSEYYEAVISTQKNNYFDPNQDFWRLSTNDKPSDIVDSTYNVTTGTYDKNEGTNDYTIQYRYILSTKGISYRSTDVNGKTSNSKDFNTTSYIYNGAYYIYDETVKQFAKFEINDNDGIWDTIEKNNAQDSQDKTNGLSNSKYILLTSKQTQEVKKYYKYTEYVNESFFYDSGIYWSQNDNNVSNTSSKKYEYVNNKNVYKVNFEIFNPVFSGNTLYTEENKLKDSNGKYMVSDWMSTCDASDSSLNCKVSNDSSIYDTKYLTNLTVQYATQTGSYFYSNAQKSNNWFATSLSDTSTQLSDPQYKQYYVQGKQGLSLNSTKTYIPSSNQIYKTATNKLCSNQKSPAACYITSLQGGIFNGSVKVTNYYLSKSNETTGWLTSAYKQFENNDGITFYEQGTTNKLTGTYYKSGSSYFYDQEIANGKKYRYVYSVYGWKEGTTTYIFPKKGVKVNDTKTQNEIEHNSNYSKGFHGTVKLDTLEKVNEVTNYDYYYRYITESRSGIYHETHQSNLYVGYSSSLGGYTYSKKNDLSYANGILTGAMVFDDVLTSKAYNNYNISLNWLYTKVTFTTTDNDKTQTVYFRQDDLVNNNITINVNDTGGEDGGNLKWLTNIYWQHKTPNDDGGNNAYTDELLSTGYDKCGFLNIKKCYYEVKKIERNVTGHNAYTMNRVAQTYNNAKKMIINNGYSESIYQFVKNSESFSYIDIPYTEYYDYEDVYINDDTKLYPNKNISETETGTIKNYKYYGKTYISKQNNKFDYRQKQTEYIWTELKTISSDDYYVIKNPDEKEIKKVERSYDKNATTASTTQLTQSKLSDTKIGFNNKIDFMKYIPFYRYKKCFPDSQTVNNNSSLGGIKIEQLFISTGQKKYGDYTLNWSGSNNFYIENNYGNGVTERINYTKGDNYYSVYYYTLGNVSKVGQGSATGTTKYLSEMSSPEIGNDGAIRINGFGSAYGEDLSKLSSIRGNCSIQNAGTANQTWTCDTNATGWTKNGSSRTLYKWQNYVRQNTTISNVELAYDRSTISNVTLSQNGNNYYLTITYNNGKTQVLKSQTSKGVESGSKIYFTSSNAVKNDSNTLVRDDALNKYNGTLKVSYKLTTPVKYQSFYRYDNSTQTITTYQPSGNTGSLYTNATGTYYYANVNDAKNDTNRITQITINGVKYDLYNKFSSLTNGSNYSITKTQLQLTSQSLNTSTQNGNNFPYQIGDGQYANEYYYPKTARGVAVMQASKAITDTWYKYNTYTLSSKKTYTGNVYSGSQYYTKYSTNANNTLTNGFNNLTAFEDSKPSNYNKSITSHNLLDIIEFVYGNKLTKDNMTKSVNSNGLYTFKATTSNSGWGLSLQLKPNTTYTYTVSGYGSNMFLTAKTGNTVATQNTFNKSISSNEGIYSLTFTTDSSGYVTFLITGNTTNSVAYVNWLQVEEGSKFTYYLPYQSNVVSKYMYDQSQSSLSNQYHYYKFDLNTEQWYDHQVSDKDKYNDTAGWWGQSIVGANALSQPSVGPSDDVLTSIDLTKLGYKPYTYSTKSGTKCSTDKCQFVMTKTYREAYHLYHYTFDALGNTDTPKYFAKNSSNVLSVNDNSQAYVNLYGYYSSLKTPSTKDLFFNQSTGKYYLKDTTNSKFYNYELFKDNGSYQKITMTKDQLADFQTTYVKENTNYISSLSDLDILNNGTNGITLVDSNTLKFDLTKGTLIVQVIYKNENTTDIKEEIKINNLKDITKVTYTTEKGDIGNLTFKVGLYKLEAWKSYFEINVNNNLINNEYELSWTPIDNGDGTYNIKYLNLTSTYLKNNTRYLNSNTELNTISGSEYYFMLNNEAIGSDSQSFKLKSVHNTTVNVNGKLYTYEYTTYKLEIVDNSPIYHQYEYQLDLGKYIKKSTTSFSDNLRYSSLKLYYNPNKPNGSLRYNSFYSDANLESDDYSQSMNFDDGRLYVSSNNLKIDEISKNEYSDTIFVNTGKKYGKYLLKKASSEKINFNNIYNYDNLDKTNSFETLDLTVDANSSSSDHLNEAHSKIVNFYNATSYMKNYALKISPISSLIKLNNQSSFFHWTGQDYYLSLDTLNSGDTMQTATVAGEVNSDKLGDEYAVYEHLMVNQGLVDYSYDSKILYYGYDCRKDAACKKAESDPYLKQEENYTGFLYDSYTLYMVYDTKNLQSYNYIDRLNNMMNLLENYLNTLIEVKYLPEDGTRLSFSNENYNASANKTRYFSQDDIYTAIKKSKSFMIDSNGMTPVYKALLAKIGNDENLNSLLYTLTRTYVNENNENVSLMSQLFNSTISALMLNETSSVYEGFGASDRTNFHYQLSSLKISDMLNDPYTGKDTAFNLLYQLVYNAKNNDMIQAKYQELYGHEINTESTVYEINYAMQKAMQGSKYEEYYVLQKDDILYIYLKDVEPIYNNITLKVEEGQINKESIKSLAALGHAIGKSYNTTNSYITVDNTVLLLPAIYIGDTIPTYKYDKTGTTRKVSDPKDYIAYAGITSGVTYSGKETKYTTVDFGKDVLGMIGTMDVTTYLDKAGVCKFDITTMKGIKDLGKSLKTCGFNSDFLIERADLLYKVLYNATELGGKTQDWVEKNLVNEASQLVNNIISSVGSLFGADVSVIADEMEKQLQEEADDSDEVFQRALKDYGFAYLYAEFALINNFSQMLTQTYYGIASGMLTLEETYVQTMVKGLQMTHIIGKSQAEIDSAMVGGFYEVAKTKASNLIGTVKSGLTKGWCKVSGWLGHDCAEEVTFYTLFYTHRSANTIHQTIVSNNTHNVEGMQKYLGYYFTETAETNYYSHSIRINVSNDYETSYKTRLVQGNLDTIYNLAKKKIIKDSNEYEFETYYMPDEEYKNVTFERKGQIHKTFYISYALYEKYKDDHEKLYAYTTDYTVYGEKGPGTSPSAQGNYYGVKGYIYTFENLYTDEKLQNHLQVWDLLNESYLDDYVYVEDDTLFNHTGSPWGVTEDGSNVLGDMYITNIDESNFVIKNEMLDSYTEYEYDNVKYVPYVENKNYKVTETAPMETNGIYMVSIQKPEYMVKIEKTRSYYEYRTLYTDATGSNSYSDTTKNKLITDDVFANESENKLNVDDTVYTSANNNFELLLKKVNLLYTAYDDKTGYTLTEHDFDFIQNLEYSLYYRTDMNNSCAIGYFEGDTLSSGIKYCYYDSSLRVIDNYKTTNTGFTEAESEGVNLQWIYENLFDIVVKEIDETHSEYSLVLRDEAVVNITRLPEDTEFVFALRLRYLNGKTSVVSNKYFKTSSDMVMNPYGSHIENALQIKDKYTPYVITNGVETTEVMPKADWMLEHISAKVAQMYYTIYSDCDSKFKGEDAILCKAIPEKYHLHLYKDAEQVVGARMYFNLAATGESVSLDNSDDIVFMVNKQRYSGELEVATEAVGNAIIFKNIKSQFKGHYTNAQHSNLINDVVKDYLLKSDGTINFNILIEGNTDWCKKYLNREIKVTYDFYWASTRSLTYMNFNMNGHFDENDVVLSNNEFYNLDGTAVTKEMYQLNSYQEEHFDNQIRVLDSSRMIVYQDGNYWIQPYKSGSGSVIIQ